MGKYSTAVKQREAPQERQFSPDRNVPENPGKQFNARKTQAAPAVGREHNRR
jgi:hypothetical protein